MHYELIITIMHYELIITIMHYELCIKKTILHETPL